MKLNIRNLFLSVLAAGALTACDNIADEDRLVYHPQPKAERTVLIEDFTGQKCVNCPAMADQLALYANNYGHDKVVIVAHHSGSFSMGIPAVLNPLHNEESQHYFDLFGMNAQPAVIINHSGSIINTSNEVAAPLATALSQETPVTINAAAAVKEEKIEVTAEINTVERIDDVKLMVWILENNIKAVQFFPNNIVEKEYAHNHVFRKSMTAIDGESLGTLAAGSNTERTYSVALESAWNKEKLDIVVVVMKNNVAENVKKVEVK